MPGPTLDPARQALLDETRRLVAEVASRLEGLGVADATRKALADSREQLALPFLLVVVGEFNAGKSAFINALLGARVLEEGVTPTTSRVGILQHGSRGDAENAPATGSRRRPPPPRSCARSRSWTRRGRTRSCASTRRSPATSCRGRTSCSSSPRPTAPTPRASGPSSRRSGSGARRWCSSSTRPTSWRRRRTWRRSSRSCATQAGKTLGRLSRGLRGLRAGRRCARAEQGDAAGSRGERPARLRGEGHGDARRDGALPPQARRAPLGVARRAHREATSLVVQRLERAGGRPRRPRGDRDAGARAVGRD